jgi:hypothetical protein
MQKNQNTDTEKGGKETQLPADKMGDGSPIRKMRQEKIFPSQNILSCLSFHQMFAPVNSEVTISNCLFAAMFPLLLSLHIYHHFPTHLTFRS